MPRNATIRSLESPKRAVMRSRIWRADASSPVRRAASNRFSWIVHVSGVSRLKRSDNGHGNDEVGDVERMRGAFCERCSAVWGGICDGGERRLAVDMASFLFPRLWRG
jgi:hypothetical protein